MRSAGNEHGMRRNENDSGQTTILMALFLGTFLFGFVGLGLDIQYMYRAKRMVQAAADAAALAAAEESGNATAQQTAAEAVARLNGFDTNASVNPATVTLHTPPTQGNFTSASYVEAIVKMPVPTIFMGLANHKTSLLVGARAVAASGLTSPTCVCLEGGTGTDLSLANNSYLSATGCGIAVNSTSSNAVTLETGATLSALSLGTVSTNWDNSTNVSGNASITPSTKVVQGIGTSCQPSLPPAPPYSPALCTADPQSKHTASGSVYSVGPGTADSTTQYGNTVCYTSLDLGKSNSTVTLNPGIYVINGGALHFWSKNSDFSNYGGNGVFFYLTNGASFTIDSGANVSLTAMTSGTYSGVMIQQEAADTNTLSIAEGSNATFNGAIYAPSAALAVSNGSGSTMNGPVVAKSLSLSQDSTLTSVPISNLGTMNYSVAKITE
jgi:hypothetical protein